MSKICLDELGVFTLLGIRFLMAFVLLAPFMIHDLIHVRAKTLINAMTLGGLSSLVMACEVTGLRTADASSAAFLENTAIIFVPAIEAVISHRLPERKIIISVLIAMTGIALLTLRDGRVNLSSGEMLCLVAAVLYACAVILTERLSHLDKPLLTGLLQVGFMGLFCFIIAIFTEDFAFPKEAQTWEALMMLVMLCTCFGFVFQPMAQSKLTPERAGLFCAIGPVGGALTGFLVLGEHITLAGLAGMILILAAVIAPVFLTRSQSQSGSCRY